MRIQGLLSMYFSSLMSSLVGCAVGALSSLIFSHLTAHLCIFYCVSCSRTDTALLFPYIVVAGDPLQLGPVHRNRASSDSLVYQCRTFRDSFVSRWGMVALLSGFHRQSPTSWFSACLDRIRLGSVTDTDLVVLNATSDGVSDTAWNSRTQLRALNRQVAPFNELKMRQLFGVEHVYESYDVVSEGIVHPSRRAYALSRAASLAPPSVTLKPGATVLTTREVSGTPTATQGVVLQCLEASVVCRFGEKTVQVEFLGFDFVDNCNQRLVTRFCIPLTLAWAMTIHRAQGASLETLAVDFSDMHWREQGLAYSGMSRCMAFESLFVRGLRREHIVVSADALAFYESM